MSFYFENQQVLNSNNNLTKSQLLKSYRNTVFEFKKITKKIAVLKIIFLLVFLFEFFLSVFLIMNYSKSSLIAVALGLMVLTVFTFFVILFYMQAKKPEQILELKQRFVDSCRHSISVPQGLAEHHLSVASALMKLSYYLYGIEYTYFNTSAVKSKLLEKFSCFFYLEDVYKMQEMLVIEAIEEHITQIKATPTDLELHVSLAHAYVSLAKLYMDMKKKSMSRGGKKRFFKTADKKIEIASRQAVEEFVILKEFAPNDPWIHAQLAQSYHTLKMYEDEAKEYEMMIELSPNDLEIKYRLGKIYFSLGRNAEGLQIYGELKKEDFKKADELLSCYSATRSLEELEYNNL